MNVAFSIRKLIPLLCQYYLRVCLIVITDYTHASTLTIYRNIRQSAYVEVFLSVCFVGLCVKYIPDVY